jgi:excinuclease ABC subunit C
MALKDKIKNIPKSSGVYLMKDAASRIIYIGKAVNLQNRIKSYFHSDRTSKTHAVMSSLRHIDFILTASETDSLLLENDLIKKHKPYYNVMLRDDKTYPYLKLTSREDFPRLLLTRKHVKDGNEYFGPYPNAGNLKSLLRWLQKIFKWRPCKLNFSHSCLPKESKIKSCLYLHTGNCLAPCTGKINPKEYRKNLKDLKLFLNGRHKKLISGWKKEMKKASMGMQYEKAKEIRDRIYSLEIMHERVTIREMKPDEIKTSLKITRTLEETKEILNLPGWPIIIECFDTSNTSGAEPVGSMVRFLNGKPDKSNY